MNALEVHRRALELGIGVSPGPLFSSRSDLPNHLRLNCANEPTPRLLGAVGQVGEICRGLVEGAAARQGAQVGQPTSSRAARAP